MTVAEIYETMEYGPAPESAKTALEWIAERGGGFGLFIGGEWRQSSAGETFETVNPATGKALARVTQGSAADVAPAFAPARAAQPGRGGPV
jgi:aldehyde dehydrogenase (NAD+)